MLIKCLSIFILKGLGWLFLGFIFLVLGAPMIPNLLIKMNTFCQAHFFSLLLWNFVVLIVIYLGFPFLIKLLIKRNKLKPDPDVLKKVSIGRFYLIGILVLLLSFSYLG